jgi:hypothetical protein
MKTDVAKFTITVPDTHPEAGKKIDKAFEYPVCENDAEAAKVLADKKLSILDMVNEKLKANARSNAYQNALLPYKPSEVSQDDIVERMVRDFIRMGKTEEFARAKVAEMLAE